MVNQCSINNITCEPELFPPTSHVSSIRFIAFIHIFSAAVAIMGNTLVALTICLNQRLQTFTNYFILSLSIADGVVGVIGQPLMAYLLWNKNQCKCTFQKIQYFAGSASCGASGLLLMLVSIERYLHICKPFFYARCVNARRIAIIIIIITSSSMLLTSIGLTGISRRAYSSILLGFYVMALLCITPCYIFIYRTTLYHVRRIDNAVKTIVLVQQKRSRRSALTILVVVLVFLVCWAPFFITNFVWGLRTTRRSTLIHTVYYYALTFGYFNSCLNPFLYTYNNTALRHGVLHTVVQIFGRRFSTLCCIAEAETTVARISINPETNHRIKQSYKEKTTPHHQENEFATTSNSCFALENHSKIA